MLSLSVTVNAAERAAVDVEYVKERLGAYTSCVRAAHDAKLSSYDATTAREDSVEVCRAQRDSLAASVPAKTMADIDAKVAAAMERDVQAAERPTDGADVAPRG